MPKEPDNRIPLIATAIARRANPASARETWRGAGLIIAREYKNQVARRAFIISTVILLALAAAAAFIPTISRLFSEPTTKQVVVINLAGLNQKTLSSAAETALNGTASNAARPAYWITYQPAAAMEDAEKAVANGQVTILLACSRSADGSLRLIDVTNAGDNDEDLPRIQALAEHLSSIDRATRLGLSLTQTRSLLTPADLTVVHSKPARPFNEMVLGYVLAFAGALLIYISVSIYASSVAVGVAEEKSSRVMELLVNVVTPFQLLAGKVLGIGAACLTQMALLVVVGIDALLLQTPVQAALFGSNAGSFSQTLAGIAIPFYLNFLLYFMLNFLLYATLYAGLGVMVNRKEEVAKAVRLPALLLIASWLLGFYTAFYPNTPLVIALSYIPLFTAPLMLARIGVGKVSGWEIAATAAILMAAIAASAWFSARLYRVGALWYGKTPSLREVVKIAKGSG